MAIGGVQILGQHEELHSFTFSVPKVIQKRQRAIGVVVILLAAVVFGMASLFYPLSADHGIMATVGYSLLDGGVPYKDAWDFKPPGIFFLFALSGLLFGKHMMVIRVVDLVWQTLTALVVSAITKHVSVYKAAGPIAGVFYLFGYYSWTAWDTAQSDSFLSLPLALSVLLVLQARRRKGLLSYAFSGLSIAIATLFKYPVGILLPLIMVVAVLSRAGPRKAWAAFIGRKSLVCGSILLGFLVPLVGCWLFFWLRGAWGEIVYVQFILAPRLAREALGARSMLRHLELARAIPGPSYRLLAGLSVAAMVWLGLRKHFFLGVWLVVAWLAVASGSLMMQARFWGYHYQPLLPPMAILASIGFYALFRERHPAKRFAVVLSVVLLLPAVWASLSSYSAGLRAPAQIILGRKSLESHYASFWKGGFSCGAALEIAKLLRADTLPGDRIQVWGHNAVPYVLADRRPASRFVWSDPLYASWAVREHRLEFVETLRRQRPKYFIVWKNDDTFLLSGVKDDSFEAFQKFGELREFIEGSYTEVRDEENYKVFKLRT